MVMEFPGFPCNDFDFHFEEAGSALAGLILRDRYGYPVPGVLPSTESLLTAGTGWEIRVAPFVAVRAKGRAVLLGGTSQELQLEVAPAPSANARLDVIYSLPAEVGSGDPVEAARVVTGTPGAVPVKPSIPEGAIELGIYRSQAGQSSAAQGILTETSTFTALTGGRLIARTKSSLDMIDALDGTRALVLADKQSYERVTGEWLGGGTFPYVSPFSGYTAGTRVTVEVEDGMVTVSGVATTSRPADLVGTTSRLMARIGERYGPRRSVNLVMQGSGANHWSIFISPSGDISAERYGPGTPGSGVWLPFCVTYPLKR